MINCKKGAVTKLNLKTVYVIDATGRYISSGRPVIPIARRTVVFLMAPISSIAIQTYLHVIQKPLR